MVTRNWNATNGTTQVHYYGGPGGLENTTNHWENLRFTSIDAFSHGHHGRSGGGNDTINFMDFDQIRNTVAGRLEDFDYSRDQIRLNGVQINLMNLPSNARIVEFNGDHNDVGSLPQQWLLINTGQGHIFYALEGARIDMNGNGAANEGEQERHFPQNPPNLAALATVAYIDPQNIVPAGFTPLSGGIVINDVDATRADVLAVINGSAGGDLIAGGLNDDRINGNSGNDRIWAGSGHDTVDGGVGDDTILGNMGNDSLLGGDGNDSISGGHHNDILRGGNGNDRLFGEHGNDTIFGDIGNDSLDGGIGNDSLLGGSGLDTLLGGDGNDILRGENDGDRLFGGHGNDTIFGDFGNDSLDGGSGNDSLLGGSGVDTLIGGDGNDILRGQNDSDRLFGDNGNDTIFGDAGNDLIRGGQGRDVVNGGAGADVFEFRAGDMLDWDNLVGTPEQRTQQLDVISDFALNVDQISFVGVAGVASRADLMAWKTVISGNTFFTVQVNDTRERVLVDVEDTTSWAQFFTDTNFVFG